MQALSTQQYHLPANSFQLFQLFILIFQKNRQNKDKQRKSIYLNWQNSFKFNILHLYSQLIIQRELQQVKMIDESKRSLRVRKNPKYLNSDVPLVVTQEQDPDKVSFSQLKSHHDYSSSQNQKTQDAKILVKLIQKVNKNYKAYLNQLASHATEAQKHEQSQNSKKVQNPQEIFKKGGVNARQTKKQTIPRNKPLYNIKSQPQQKEHQSFKPSDTSSLIQKQPNSFSHISGIGKGIFTDQLKKLQSLYPEMKNISYQSLTQNINPNLFSGVTGVVQGQKKKQAPLKSVFAEQKLFKRSAYHVAIAYHIYLKNLKQKGGVIGNEIDPTYHAKKLKQTRPLE